MQLIACSPETPRVPPPYDEIDIYDIQERVIQNILTDFAQQQAAAVVEKPVAVEQNIVSQVLRQYLASPGVDRDEIKTLRSFLRQPLVGAAVTRLRQALQEYSATGDAGPLIAAVRDLYTQQALPAPAHRPRQLPLVRTDLHLVCYEYVI